MKIMVFLTAAAAFVVSPLFADATAAREALIKAADRALQTKPVSVMDKKKLPPSGDKHDYLSQAPYWWPDPSKPDGLPYIRRDGETIPSRSTDDFDRTSIGRMIGAVSTLGAGFKETGDEKYAEHATKLLRVWFLDPATKMNPNLNYAQGIPGITEGRGIGIIDTSGLVGVVKACEWLEKSKAFTNADRKGMKDWIGSYLNWMLTSKNGKEEAAAFNNHGTYYDLQAVTFALYTGQKEIAQKIVEEAKVSGSPNRSSLTERCRWSLLVPRLSPTARETYAACSTLPIWPRSSVSISGGSRHRMDAVCARRSIISLLMWTRQRNGRMSRSTPEG